MNYDYEGEYGEVNCSDFFDPEEDCGGVDIYLDSEYVGPYLGIEIPDKEDVEACQDFEQKVDAWLDENSRY